jgi:N-carbamoylputrescine amidase
VCKLSACRNCSRPSISASAKIPDCSIWRNPIPGSVTTRLSALAKQLHIVLIASLFERRAAGVYHNTAAIFDADGSLRGLYRKMHIPDDPLYYEKYYFTPGDLATARLTPA